MGINSRKLLSISSGFCYLVSIALLNFFNQVILEIIFQVSLNSWDEKNLLRIWRTGKNEPEVKNN